jgi:hypothetical protein
MSEDNPTNPPKRSAKDGLILALKVLGVVVVAIVVVIGIIFGTCMLTFRGLR